MTTDIGRRAMQRPVEHIRACADARGRLLDALSTLTDEQAAAPSLLPGWSRGHVITHLARKADGHVWLFEGALLAEVREMYPRPNMRENDIEAGAGRSAEELLLDLRAAFTRIEATFDNLPDDLWGREGIVQPGPRAMSEIVPRHLRDVEVHHVDLDLGYTPSDWSQVFVEAELAKRLPALADRADHAMLLAWLLGRADVPDLAAW